NQDDTQNKTKNLSFDEMPNEKTVFEIIEAKSIDENDALLVALQTQLLKDQFEFVEKESGTSWSENDCTNNKVIQVKGDGIRSYRAESLVKVGQKNNIRPDFSLLVFAFEDAQLAEKNFISLKTAVESDNGFCNGKSPEVIVRNGNEVFYFTSRAEMFRSYLDQYSQYVEDYKAEKQP
ncbi:MAG: hypothetical protein RR677_11855, partial [Acinetobacter sp.]